MLYMYYMVLLSNVVPVNFNYHIVVCVPSFVLFFCESSYYNSLTVVLYSIFIFIQFFVIKTHFENNSKMHGLMVWV